ncbi:4Fe-4S binding protein, partial [Candidatus Bathyarchaeota archaeon]|nr:4Fe-4S binding protein [Candidatus Bathyarchaeota archaeon]
GSEHAKWQPVSVCTVRPVSKITVDRKKCNGCEKCIVVCPKHILMVDAGKIKLVDDEKCNGCKQCKASCSKDAVQIEDSQEAFIFNIESVGGLPPEIIFDKAIDFLTEKANELIDGLSNLKLEEEEQ